MDVERLGKYEIRGILGRGAMGTVYDGWDPVIARRVAIKTIRLLAEPDREPESQLPRFRREAEAAGRLIHPNIVGVFDYGETADLAYIIMEFVDGPSLKSLMAAQQRFSVADTMRIMEDLLAGLGYSHRHGVVHRDIKPANVMLTAEGRAKIADFGVAQIETSGLTQAGAVIGTPAYMSPEQFTGEPADARSDIYSSGVVLYQLLTGERPFEGSVSAIMHRALNTEPPPPSQLSVTVPLAFDQVVRRAMAKRPADRFASAEQFADALRTAAAGQATPEIDATMVVVPKRLAANPTMRPRLKWLLAGVIAAASIAGAAAWVLSVPRTPPATLPQAVAAAPSPDPRPAVGRPSAVAMRRQLDEALANADCMLAHPDLSNIRSPTVTGLSAESTANALRLTLAGIVAPDTLNWRVTSIAPRFCAVLNLLRPITDGDNLHMRLATGEKPLRGGDLIRPHLTMPDFAGELRVDYVKRDGTVAHIYPFVGDPAHLLAAGETLDLGEPGPGQPTWEVAPPYGTELIIAIASTTPLLPAPPADGAGSSATDYVHELQAAVTAARKRGVRVAGAVLPVETRPHDD